MPSVMPATTRKLRAMAMVSLVGLVVTGCGPHLAQMATPAEGARLSARSEGDRAGWKAPTGYYAKAETLTGRKLMLELQRITKKGHRDLGYDVARDAMFGTVDDLDGDDRLRGVYTGYQVIDVRNRKDAYHQDMNAEHTWPQSMGAVGIAKSDLHHLFPTLMQANSTRNNYPFGDVRRVNYSLPDYAGDGQVSKIGWSSMVGFTGARMVFEPRPDHKGNVARALFYFFTRYGNHEGKKTHIDVSNFELEHDSLLRWHEEDPVDAAEKARNQAVFKVQGNRNPFVDHPEFVKKIGRFLPVKQ